MASELHPTLASQLRTLGLSPGQAPDATAFVMLLAQVSRVYAEVDRERDRIDRSQAIATQETAALDSAVRESQAHLASLLSLSADWVWEQDGDGVFTYVSDDLEQRTGLSGNALLGHACATAGTLRCTPDELARVQRCRELRQPFHDLMIEVVAPAGAACFMRISGEPRFDGTQFTGYQGVGNDATAAVLADRRVHEIAHDKLKAQLEFSARLLEVSPTPVFVKDAQGRFVTVNQAWLDLMAMSLDQVIGRHSADLFGPEAPLHTEHDERLMKSQGHISYENRLRRPGHPPRDTIVTKVRFAEADGTPAGIVGSIVDVTEFREAERSTREARDAAERANHAKSSFLANMSHEIRTPLTSIIGFAELLMDPHGSPDDKGDAARTIVRNGRHLLELINDILDLSKIETRQVQIERIEVGLPKLLREIEALAAGRAREKSLRFSIVPELPLPAALRTDPVRLKQILLNFCSNAIKFSTEGEIRLQVSFAPQTSLLRFDVSDCGIGMSAEQIARLFMPFAQADVSTTRKFGGTGLGLYISKQLAELLGAEVGVVSEPQVGSCFSVTIPVGMPIDPAQMLTDLRGFEDVERPDFQVSQIAVPALDGRVLVAEDGVDNQRLLAAYLRQAGLAFDMVDNGSEAVERATRNDYALVLMDIQMPVMDGVTATRRLRSAGYTGPIVALTANVMQSDVATYRQGGFDDVLAKPIDRGHFYAVLQQYVGGADADADTIPGGLDGYERELQALTAEFRAGLPDTLAAIDTAAQVGDWSTLRALAHTLKGTAGSYGYANITAIAAELEVGLTGGPAAPTVDACLQLTRRARHEIAAPRGA